MRAHRLLPASDFTKVPRLVAHYHSKRLNAKMRLKENLLADMPHSVKELKNHRAASFLDWQLTFIQVNRTLPFREYKDPNFELAFELDDHVWRQPMEAEMFWPGNKRAKKSGRWIRLTKAPHVSIELTEGMIFFAKERPDDWHGFDRDHHRYSVVIDVPGFGSLRLWPYEYETVTTRNLIEDLLDGATEFVPGPEAAALYSEQLFYIMSRGIPRETALPMALSSFIDRKRGRSKVPGYFRPTPLVMGVYAYDEMVAKLADAKEAAADEQALATAAVQKGKTERRLLRFEKTRIKTGKAFFGGRI